MSSRAYTPLAAPVSKMMKPTRPALAEPGNTCRLRLQFGIYFDGTNNNASEDRPTGSQSNVVRLFDVAQSKSELGLLPIYIQGVGTPFEQIGEKEPHERGSSMGAMGYARIRFAQIAMANRVALLLQGKEIIEQQAMPAAVDSDSILPRLARQLTHLITTTRTPTLSEIVLDVFGFSRGAAAARSFLNQLQKNFCQVSGFYCGVPLRIRFVGLFDTVASVGLADSFPMPVDGHMSWGDQDLLVLPDTVEQCVHLVAGHEGRNSFPVDLVLKRDGAYSPGVIEIVYPGMHSDVGGGYGPTSQGKGSVLNEGHLQTEAHMLSQLALNDMYDRAVAAGVPLRSRKELESSLRARAAFAVHPALRASFNDYFRCTGLDGKALSVKQHYRAHRRLYLGWRKHVLGKAAFERQWFVMRANAQDKLNLIEANDQLRAYVTKLQGQERQIADYKERQPMLDARVPPPVVDDRGIVLHREDWVPAPVPTQGTMDFFSQYVHDSRAGFLLTDPISEHDHQVIHRRLAAKDKKHREQLLAYERRLREYQSGQWAGHASMAGLVRPLDPLSPMERKNLGIYESGQRPVYEDASPATKSDGDFGLKHMVLGAMDGRREMGWSYLHPRQMFAFGRI